MAKGAAVTTSCVNERDGASKPLLTHRKRIRRRQNRRRAILPGSSMEGVPRRPVWRKRDPHSGFRTKPENLIGDVKRRGTSGSNREAESIDASIRVFVRWHEPDDRAAICPVEASPQVGEGVVHRPKLNPANLHQRASRKNCSNSPRNSSGGPSRPSDITGVAT